MALALLSLCLPTVGRALNRPIPPPVQLLGHQERYEIGPHCAFLLDPDNSWSIEEISSPSFLSGFSPLGSATLNLGITDTTVWVRFGIAGEPPVIPGREGKKEPLLLDLGYVFFDSMEAYVIRPALGQPGRIEKIPISGVRSFAGSEAGQKPEVVIRLPELLSTEQTIYLKLRADGAFFLNPVITTVRDHFTGSVYRMLWFGAYFGLLLGLLLYNLFLFFGLRDRSYLWYVLSFAAVGFYFLGTNRLTYEFLTDFPPSGALRLNLGFLSLSLVALLLFARCFLQTSQRAPKADRMLLGMTLMQTGLMVPVLFAPVKVLNLLYSFICLAVPVLIISAAVICWRRGYRPARFLVLSWIFFGVGGLVYDLTFLGIIPFNVYTFHSFQIGTAADAVLLSFALADRINLLRREREELSNSERRHRQLAFTDVLTGLFNLRYFKTQIDVQMELAQRTDQKLTLMMLDLDNFKLLNDTHGHLEGDRVLATLGKIMSSCIRERDIASRYGGEEFAIILPGGRNSTAIEIYERINAEIIKCRFGTKGKDALVTLSIGVAEMVPGETAEGIILRADQALYEAKARGRNQIVIAGREPAVFFSCIQEQNSEVSTQCNL